jgi:hypothetical protein
MVFQRASGTGRLAYFVTKENIEKGGVPETGLTINRVSS